MHRLRRVPLPWYAAQEDGVANLFDVGSRQEQGGFHEEEALLEREQRPLIDSVVALHETGIIRRQRYKHMHG